MIWAVLGAAVVVAAFVQGVIGVGFGLVFAPVVALLRPDLLPVLPLVLMLPLNAWVWWRERVHVDRPGALWTTIGRFAGTFAGLWILAVVSLAALDLFVGVTTIAAALASRFAPAFAPNRQAFLAAGLITGVTETAAGIGGPPLALVYQYHAAPALRTTIALCFLVGEVFSLALLALQGRGPMADVGIALALTPALAAGLALSSRARDWVDATRLRQALLAFALVSGLALIAQALRG